MAGDRVLVVEDEPTNLKLMQVLLSAEGFEVHAAANAEEALRLLPSLCPRAVLVDLGLPGMDGLELTRRIRRHRAVTAHAIISEERRALDAGCDACFTKPIDTRTFAARLREHIARADAWWGDD